MPPRSCFVSHASYVRLAATMPMNPFPRNSSFSKACADPGSIGNLGCGDPVMQGDTGGETRSGPMSAADQATWRRNILDSVDFDALEHQAHARMLPASMAFCAAGAD